MKLHKRGFFLSAIASSLCVKGVMLNTCSAHCTHIDNIISTRHHSAERESQQEREKAKNRGDERERERLFVIVLHLNDHRLREHEHYVIPRVTAFFLSPFSPFFLSSLSSSLLLVFMMSSP